MTIEPSEAISSQNDAQENSFGPEQPTKIYLVTDGLKSSHTKLAYRLAFDHFIKTTVKSHDLRALLDTKQNIIESKIIDHITYPKDVQRLTYLSIQVHLSGIFHFFERMITISIPRRSNASYQKTYQTTTPETGLIQ